MKPCFSAICPKRLATTCSGAFPKYDNNTIRREERGSAQAHLPCFGKAHKIAVLNIFGWYPLSRQI